MTIEKIINPSRIGEFVSFEQCPRYFKFAVNELSESEYHDRDEYPEAFQALNPLLSKAGHDFEDYVVEGMKPHVDMWEDFTLDEDTFRDDHDAFLGVVEETIDAPPSTDAPTMLLQTGFAGQIGAWTVRGDADIVLVWPTDRGATIRVLDVKSAAQERTYHQIQAATYAILIKDLLRMNIGLDEIGAIETGIITRENEYIPVTTEVVPAFDRRAREDDVRRLLAPDGKFDTLFKRDFGDVAYQIGQKCANCAYNEACFTDSIEDGGVRLLGLSPGEQAVLAGEGIETVEDFANLAYTPDEWAPNSFETPTVTNHETYETLMSQPGLGERLSELIPRAQAMYGALGGRGVNAHTARAAPWVPRSGYGSLPDDNPPDSFDIDYQEGSLVRVYLNVQHDHLRDRLILLSARVNATISESDPQRFSHLSEDAPDEENESLAVEQALIDDFLEELFESIQHVAEGIDLCDADHDYPPVHFYLYDSAEQKALQDAIERHETPRINALQTLLDQREGVDQPMLSAVRSDVLKRKALKTPAPGLLHVYHQTRPPRDVYTKPRTDWTYTPSNASPDAEPIDLTQVFKRRLFDIRVPYEEHHDGLRLFPNENKRRDGWFNSRVRFGAQIPLGYLWAAIGRIDDDWVAEIEEEQTGAEDDIAAFRYRDTDTQDEEIRPIDVEALGRHLCDAVEHVERGLDIKDARVEKRPLNTDALAEYAHAPPSLSVACQDYLDIEYTVGRRDTHNLFRRPPEQRILSGRSIPLVVANATPDDDDPDVLRVEGRLIYHEMDFENPDIVRRGCRQKGAEGTTGGSWMVATPFNIRGDQPVTRAYEIERCPAVTIQDLNLEGGTIEFTVRPSPYNGEYGTWHHNWTTDPAEADPSGGPVLFARNETFILDPQIDDIPKERARLALEHADQNELHDLLEDIRTGLTTTPQTDRFDEAPLQTFANWVRHEYGPAELPSDRQAAVIEASRPQLVMLQGPPGTGKTSGALGPTIIGRCFAAEHAGDGLTGLVTGPSNKAIDEVLTKTVEIIEAFQDSQDDALGDIEIVRLTDEEPEDAPDFVRYINYHEDDDLDWLTDRLNIGQVVVHPDQQSLGGFCLDGDAEASTDTDGPAHTLVFATPTRAWGLLDNLTPGGTDDVALAARTDWDFVAVDEASMMTLPQFLLAGAFMASDAQVLVGGDHRQMPPVQQHDWTDERRQSITNIAPHLSTLDYLRLLRGDDDVIPEDTLENLERGVDPTEVEIPLIRLNTTYRCHSVVTDFLQRYVYERDDIEYESAVDPAITQPETGTDGVNAVLEPAAPLVLVVYEDENFQQFNPVEAELIAHAVAHIDSGDTVGVVTPHNAQRGLLTTVFEAVDTRIDEVEADRAEVQGDEDEAVEDDVDDDGEGVIVDTVERFQGGERDVMFMSGTVSDPEYIGRESKFLLNLNRVNVAMSRMRAKLVVVAAESVFEHIPDDPDEYEQALLWKGLSSDLGHVDQTEPAWSGSLTEFLGEAEPTLDDIDLPNVAIEVYRRDVPSEMA